MDICDCNNVRIKVDAVAFFARTACFPSDKCQLIVRCEHEQRLMIKRVKYDTKSHKSRALPF